MNRTIQYAYNRDDGLVISRVGSELAIPVYQYADFGNDGDFTGEIPMQLERFDLFAITWRDYTWTRKVPTELKNRHRQFWGMGNIK